MIVAGLAAGALLAAKVDAVAEQAQLAGVVLIARRDDVLVERGYGPVSPDGKTRHDPRARWPLASITKQVAATLLVRKHGARLDIPDRRDGLTLRQLLTHHTGLANPDATPAAAAGEMPSFYLRSAPDLAYCASGKVQPGAAFAYNNCDYLVAWDRFGKAVRWPAGMTMARRGERLVPGFVGGKPQPRFEYASFGAAAGLTGSARDVFRFDRALLTGKLLPSHDRDELWRAEGGQSYQALGQWVFPGRLNGCAAPKRIVQRDGEIQGIQTRNFIFPDDDLVVIVFTNRSSDDFKLGEVWEGRGFVYDLLSAAACP